MPLARCEVRNEYGLGQPELYREVNNEDPKAVLDGVAVAGLVGILRQLGDLAEFAAEVFHGIQEQVLITATRSHKLIVRVQNIEAKLPPLEKAVLAQTSHIHFAYTAGSRWHACIRENNNLFTYNDLPWFIMNSYEVCRGPPRLHLLDRFDSGGPGSCIKRYSDPTFFRRTSDNSNEFGAEKIQKVRKTHRAKKKRSSRRTKASAYNFASVSSQSGRIHLNPTISNGHASSSSHTASTTRRSSRRTEVSAHSESLSNHSSRIKSTTSTVIGQASPSCSFDSRARSSFIEYSLGSSETPEQQQSNASSSFIHHHDIPNSGSLDRQLEVADYFPQKSSPEQIATSSSSVTWDEKVEVVEWWYTQQSDEDEDPEILITNSDLGIQQTKTDKGENVDKENVLLAGVNPPKSSSSDGVESEPDNYVDALNAIESESESDLDCQMKHEVEKLASCVEEEGGYGELNEATMHVDEVPLKAESIAVHGLFTENELTSDLVDSIFSNYAVHEETCHSPGFEGSRSSDGIDNSNTEFTVSCAVESDSENDHDYQMKHELENLASCVGVQEELNEAMMHVADEVPLKMESIAAHDLFTENELTTDLRNPIFSNYAGQAETSDIEVTNSIPDHSPGFEGSKGSDAIDNSKAEFIVSNVVESESENDHDCQMKQGVKKLASFVDKEGVQEEFNEAMMHVADEVPLKTQSIAVHDLFIENEHTSDLLNSVFLNCVVQAEISDNAVTYLMPDHSPSFEGSKSSDAIDNSKAEFTVSNSKESESENDLDLQMKHEVEKLAYCVYKEGLPEELNESTMHVADEVPHKTEPIAADDLFSETYSMPDHSPGFEGSKSSDAIDKSKAEFTVGNAVESMSENDLHWQMKCEVEKLASCLDKEVVQEELNKATMLSLKTESIAANDLFTENEHTSDISNTIFLNCAVQAETSGNAVTYSEPDHSPGFEGPKSSDAIDNSKAKFIVSNPSSETSNQDQLLSDKTITASCNSQVSLDTTTSIPPVSLWTNGGLLGLEPSKPPDFVVLGNSGRDSVFTEASALGPENHTSILNEKCEKGKAEKLSTGRDLSSHDSTSRHGCQDVEIGKTRDSHLVDGSYHFYVGGVNEKGATLQNQLLVDANVEASSNEACPENDGNSFQIFPFGNRFFVNNFCRRMPSVTEDRLEPDSSSRKVALEQNGRHVNAPQTTHWKAVNGDFGQEPSVESLTSSPPLEHMKISFRPFGGFESSKLQLKLPVGKSCNGSVRDTFLSFQLVPEPCTSLQVSDSEEDTFCRSSPYMSDESASHHSESDSELWESGESLDHKDHLLYDETLGRISSVDLGSGCLDPDDIDPNRLQHEPECKNAFTENDANLPLYVSSSGPLPFNAVNSVPHEEIENKLKTIMYPMPPPLPPAQWVILKPPSAVENDQQHATFDAVDQASDTKPLECTVHQCPKQESDDGQVNCEATAINANGKEQEKLSLQSEANNTANDKEINTNEDFLHQIRTKSFMLKPTTTAKALFTRDPTENDKFATRLLRRAISIRQAVGSDDGEDNSSDT